MSSSNLKIKKEEEDDEAKGRLTDNITQYFAASDITAHVKVVDVLALEVKPKTTDSGSRHNGTTVHVGSRIKTICAGVGKFTVHGGSGIANIRGSDGDIIIHGRSGMINLHGGHGTATIKGGNGAINIHRFDGNITINGGRGAITVRGGLGTMTIKGGSGSVKIHEFDGDVTVKSSGRGRIQKFGGTGQMKVLN